MKFILAATLLTGIVAAEVPSHSYLPPPPRGYPQGSSPPSVIAARTLNVNPEHQNTDHHNHDHNGDHEGVGFRSSPQSDYSTSIPQVRYSDEQGYDQNASGYPRNGLEDANTTVNYDSEKQGYPKPYAAAGDHTHFTGHENANNFRSTDYNQDGRSNGYQGNGQNGDRYGVTDQNGGRYQKNEYGRTARSNLN